MNPPEKPPLESVPDTQPAPPLTPEEQKLQDFNRVVKAVGMTVQTELAGLPADTVALALLYMASGMFRTPAETTPGVTLNDCLIEYAGRSRQMWEMYDKLAGAKPRSVIITP